MVRQANPVDFWRGLALVFIFVNHIPGIYYGRFTHANYSLSDSADLFVFLAGWALRLLVGTPERRQSTWYLVLRLGGRAITLYAAQILITMIALAMLAGCAILLDNPLLLEWHNAAAVFHDPVTTHVGLALITHQLGYFDILPLYVVLMLMAPIIAIIDRYIPQALLPISLLVYLATLLIPIPFPTWPVEGLVVLQSARLAADLRARFCDGARGRPWRFCAAPHRADPLDFSADRACRAGFHAVRLVAGPDQVSPAASALPDRQDLRHTAAADSVPGVDRAYVGDLSLHPPGVQKAGGFPVDARPQLAVRVLRRVYPEPCGADHSLHLSRQSFDRHCGGNLRYRNHGPNSMASRMARRCESQARRRAAQPS